ncbi:substrate-binding domain-containing protein [Aneurinibacillus sp. Ricciae_BoGa-3]|uniref:substrate-binding domain-containing protein n=1 Tax=Aneurinibacillus sp. Ricciae_BoGa-3 TaxID=3022697 RepID=UPI00233F959D|nr:substrate-binding domain-containing protein [Aneurinibacillus sp. Ricciae_BoGa-3]WCK53202.1 substrate-binding domain-containing protein [Aneurinibacillus sp. Ricciae_BoGa-3]
MKKKGAIKVFSLLFTLSLVAMTGCSTATSGNSKQNSPQSQNQATDDTSSLKVQNTSGKKIVIGFSQRRVAGSDWYTNLVNGASAEAKKDGVDLTVLDAQGDVAKQVSDVQDLISRGANVVIMNPQDSSGVLPAAKQLKRSKIPLVVVNSNIDPKADPVSFVSDDPRDTGYKSGWTLAKAASEKYGNKVIKAAMISGYPKEVVSQYRRNGFIAGWTDFMLEKYGKGNLDLVAERFGEWLPDKTLPEMQDISTANPDLQVIFCASDVMLPGIFTALKNTGHYGKVLIGSMDGTKDALKEIMDPQSGLVVTVSNDPRVQGADAVKIAIMAAQGQQVPSTHYIPNPVYTKDNAKQMYDPKSPY